MNPAHGEQTYERVKSAPNNTAMPSRAHLNALARYCSRADSDRCSSFQGRLESLDFGDRCRAVRIAEKNELPTGIDHTTTHCVALAAVLGETDQSDLVEVRGQALNKVAGAVSASIIDNDDFRDRSSIAEIR